MDSVSPSGSCNLAWFMFLLPPVSPWEGVVTWGVTMSGAGPFSVPTCLRGSSGGEDDRLSVVTRFRSPLRTTEYLMMAVFPIVSVAFGGMIAWRRGRKLPLKGGHRAGSQKTGIESSRPRFYRPRVLNGDNARPAVLVAVEADDDHVMISVAATPHICTSFPSPLTSPPPPKRIPSRPRTRILHSLLPPWNPPSLHPPSPSAPNMPPKPLSPSTPTAPKPSSTAPPSCTRPAPPPSNTAPPSPGATPPSTPA